MEMIHISITEKELDELLKTKTVIIGDMVETSCDSCCAEVNLEVLIKSKNTT